MTREEKIQIMDKVHKAVCKEFNSYSNGQVERISEFTRAGAQDLIQYFESRTCENCKYYHQKYLCLEIGKGDFKPESGFGCNKWEKKDEKGK